MTYKIILFDVGSHDGKEFLEIARQHSNVIVYAFEPTPWAAETIRNKTNDIPNFHVIEEAVSIIDGEMEMNIAASDSNKTDSGCNSLRNFIPDWNTVFPQHDRWYGSIDTVTVKTTRLDTFITKNNIDHINFLHVDAQGEDLNVLKSLGNKKGLVYEGIVELATNKVKKLYEDNPDILEGLSWMLENGFTVVQITPNDPSSTVVTTEHNVRFKILEINNKCRLFKNYYMDPYTMFLI